jgi:outer membrane protein assembly factor BamB
MYRSLIFLLAMSASSLGAADWPSFRGPDASGVADGMKLPAKWDAEKGEGILFKVKVPGLAHSSPVIAGQRLFLTTAVSSIADPTFKPGLYGAGTAAADRSVHEWWVICLDKRTGKTLWSKVAVKKKPTDKRHIKATYANSTPVTDGQRVVAFFGSEGLFAYTVKGEFLWKKNLGRLDVGAYDSPKYEWGTASSPIIWKGKVIVQCDTQKESFVLAVDVKTGKELWRTKRDELPSWGTPTVWPGKQPELITNGSKFIRGYNPETGKELWRLGGSSKITTPTPIFAGDRIIVASGRHPERPIFCLRPGGRGDLTGGQHVAWQNRRGPYMPTPLIYRGKVYALNNSGLFGCFDLKTGAEHFYERIRHRGNGFSASPVAADGKIYCAGEDGVVFVIEASGKFKLLAEHPVGEPLMATPALSNGVLYLRGTRSLFAVGKPRAQ